MNVQIVDAQGIELTEITSHLGLVSGAMLVDRATRPDALFHHYFAGGSRTVRVVVSGEEWSAVLRTRWQVGGRRWSLSAFLPVGAATEAAEQSPRRLSCLMPATPAQYQDQMSPPAHLRLGEESLLI